MKTRYPPEHFAKPENSIGYLSRVVFRTFSRVLERRTLEHGVSAGQWRFLRQLWLEDGITQRELSQRVGMREPTTVIALRSLEACGFIQRKKRPDDRRKTYIYLTPNAKALEEKLNPINAEIHEIATVGLSENEIETLRALLMRVHANLKKEEKKLPELSDISA